MAQANASVRHRPVIRVFVSSTFSDLKHERDALQEKVYPRLEQLCAAKRFQFQAIDLRWGIPTEAGLDHRTMRICFEELARSQQISPKPNFLILLGNRYGWRPLPEEISMEEYEHLERSASSEDLPSLQHWYRRDDNAIPPVYVLRSRQEVLPDGQTKTVDSDEWKGIEKSLWRIINVAYPPEGLTERFAQRSNDDVLPAIVRFQASATEQEIWKGALQAGDAKDHVRTFFRDIANVHEFEDDERIKPFIDLGDEQRIEQGPKQALQELKYELRRRLGEDGVNEKARARLLNRVVEEVSENGQTKSSSKLDVSTDHLQTFCDDVFKALKPIINQQIADYWKGATPGEDSPAELDRERAEHQRFGAERAPEDAFVGREELLASIDDYLRGDSRQPLVIHGASGTGKTALMARAAELARSFSPVIRFLGTTPRSSNLRSLLTSLCLEYRRTASRDEPLPLEARDLVKEWHEHLASATAQKPIVVFLDALDQLDDDEGARRLHWLPVGQLPEHVRVVVSCLSDPERNKDDPAIEPFNAFKARRLPVESMLSVDVLSEPEAIALFNRWLSKAGRKLSVAQFAAVSERIAGESCRLPLYLRILFEEARRWRSFDPVPGIGQNIAQLLGDLFDRLSLPSNHGLTVECALSYIAAGRRGLTEPEILEVLYRDPKYHLYLSVICKLTGQVLPTSPKRIPIAIWSRLRFDLLPYLAEHAVPGGTVLEFYHRQVSELVRIRYLTNGVRFSAVHGHLAEYFTVTSGEMTPRIASELPWQLVQARRSSDLLALLVDIWHLLSLARFAYQDVPGYWRWLGGSVDMTVEYDHAWSEISSTANHTIDRAATEYAGIIARVLDDCGHWSAAGRYYYRFLQRKLKENDAQGLSVQLGRRHYAAWLIRSGEFSAAEPQLRAALKELVKLLGPHHSFVLDTATDLAGLLRNLGDISGARNLHHWAMAASCFGGVWPKPAALHALAYAKFLFEHGDKHEAMDIAERAVNALQAVLGPSSPDVLLAQLELARMERNMGVSAMDTSRVWSIANRLVELLGSEHPHAKQALVSAAEWNSAIGPSRK